MHSHKEKSRIANCTNPFLSPTEPDTIAFMNRYRTKPAPVTETANPLTDRIDTLSTVKILRLISREDALVAGCVRKAIPDIARAVDIIADAFRNGGRLFYVGAGTSGRLGILDASECPPTFSTKPSLVQGIIAGGKRAVFRAIEGAEDGDGSGEISARRVSPPDVVVGIAACGKTRFVCTALQAARRRGCPTVFITSNPPAKGDPPVDVRVSVVVGPEVIAGSTRMKAGTAAKMVLNMLTTASMVKIGKTYGNLMVDLTARSEKLRDRSARIVMRLTGLSRAKAERYLKNARGKAKVATVMARRGVGYKEALRLLRKSRGFLRGAIMEEKNFPCNHTPRKSPKTDC